MHTYIFFKLGYGINFDPLTLFPEVLFILFVFNLCASFGLNPILNVLGIFSGGGSMESVVLVSGIVKSSTSTVVGGSYVASVDTFYDVVNISVHLLTLLSLYAIFFVSFR